MHFVFCVLYFVNEHNSGLTSSYYSILVVRAGISILTAISGRKPHDDDDDDEEEDVDNDIPITYMTMSIMLIMTVIKRLVINWEGRL